MFRLGVLLLLCWMWRTCSNPILNSFWNCFTITCSLSWSTSNWSAVVNVYVTSVK
jgi:hypothetical protein